jgi:hypothetical protein
VTAFPDGLPPTWSPPAAETYRPLSSAALAGFALAVVYAVIVLVGWVVSLWVHSPWVLPLPLFLIPVAAALLSWLARSQIQKSENTLAGLRLARWGIGLSVALGLSYLAYYTATYLAVRQQAGTFVEERWLKRIRDGEVEKAFLLTLPPPRLAEDDSGLHQMLLARYDTSENPAMPGPLTMFANNTLVRLLSRGKDVRVEPRGVGDWDAKKGVYEITLRYDVLTEIGEFSLEVPVVGSVGRGYSGRQWHVDRNKLRVTGLRETEAGKRYMELANSARKFTAEWIEFMGGGNRDKTYLETLAPAEQERQRKGFRKLPDLPDEKMAGEPPSDLDGEAKAYFLGRRAFVLGGLVKADEGALGKIPDPSKPGQEVDPVLAVKALFLPERGKFSGVRLAPMGRDYLPDVYLEDPIRTAMPVQIAMVNLKYMVEGRLWLEVDERDADKKEVPWRITRLELVRGHTPSVGDQRRPPAPGAFPSRGAEVP